MQDEQSPLQTAIDIIRQKEYPLSSRLNAMLYMVEKHETECQPFLESVVADPEEEEDIRGAAALSLGRLRHENAYTLISPLASQNEFRSLKNSALQALGMLGEDVSIPILLDALHDKDNTIFYSAAEALGRIGKPVVPHLTALLSNEQEPDVQCVAAWQLGTLKYAEAIPALLTVVRHGENSDVIALSLWALGEIGLGTDEVLNALSEAREKADPAIHERAALALKKIARHIN